LKRWLQHSLAGSVRGSARVLSQFQDAIGLSFGHASIQLENDFIGYWPPFREGERCTPASQLWIEYLGASAQALRTKATRTGEEEELLGGLDEALEEAAELTPYQHELQIMGREPTFTIKLPGLVESAMADYWNKRALSTAFANRAHNCCTVTQKAIEIGVTEMVNNLSFFNQIGFMTKGAFRVMFSPIKTTKTVVTKVGGDVLFWNPNNLRIYVQFIEKVVLDR
jgi:hypothetical protein